MLSHKDVMQLQANIGNKATIQLLKNYMGTTSNAKSENKEIVQKKSNRTGLPDKLKDGIENLSSIDIGDVRVHYNSDKPTQVGALAYTQGKDIHVAPGQEKYLAHEAWHVVQQKQGRVKPTMQLKGINVNDDIALEREADRMGEKSDTIKSGENKKHLNKSFIQDFNTTIQCVWENYNLSMWFNHWFNDHLAEQCVHAANFLRSFYINISGEHQETKQAFTFVRVRVHNVPMRVCVVGHTHRNIHGIYNVAGNCYIPGFNNWDMQTPPHACNAIAFPYPRGFFPGNARYPVFLH